MSIDFESFFLLFSSFAINIYSVLVWFTLNSSLSAIVLSFLKFSSGSQVILLLLLYLLIRRVLIFLSRLVVLFVQFFPVLC